MEPIKKTISIGDKSVAIMAEKIIRKDHSVVIKVTATIGSVVHTQHMKIGTEAEVVYSAEQCQTDFDAHCLKVATAATNRHNADLVTENLK